MKLEGTKEVDIGESSRRVGVNIICSSMTYNFSNMPFIFIENYFLLFISKVKNI